MQLISYHGGHSGQFCDHGIKGSLLEDIVKAKIEMGFKYFGLTEHMPRKEKEFLYFEELELNRTPEDIAKTFDEYIQEAKRLKEKYKDQAIIKVGFETEYCNATYPDYINKLREKYEVDYIVGAMHHVDGIPIDFDEYNYRKAIDDCGGIEKLYMKYYDEQFDLINRCKPEIIGHFDLIKKLAGQVTGDFCGPSEKVWVLITRNIKAVIKYGGVFEVNSRGFERGFIGPYPGEEILKIIKKNGGRITLGDDSHGVRDLENYFEKTLSLLKDIGFSELLAFDENKNQIKLPIDLGQ